MTQLTLQISEPLAQHLAWLAAEQKKSIEQVAIEQLTSSIRVDSVRGSAAAILRAISEGPHLSHEDVAEMEKAIEEGHLPPIEKGIFDEDQS
jgi:hypothetical protein